MCSLCCVFLGAFDYCLWEVMFMSPFLSSVMGQMKVQLRSGKTEVTHEVHWLWCHLSFRMAEDVRTEFSNLVYEFGVQILLLHLLLLDKELPVSRAVKDKALHIWEELYNGQSMLIKAFCFLSLLAGIKTRSSTISN